MNHLEAIDRLVFHHSASPRDTTTPEMIRRWHVEERGWDDVGYHHMIDGLGNHHPGRPIVFQGAHVRGYNTRTIGICLFGDNTKADEGWNRHQFAAAHDLIEAYAKILGREPVITSHREIRGPGETVCPGLDIREWLYEA